MANTMKALQTITVTGSASDIQFTNIPQTYTDLYLTITSAGRLTSGNTGALVIYTASGQSSALSTWKDARGANASVSSATSAYPIIGELNYQSSTNNFGVTSVYIPNYASNITKKNFMSESVTELAASEATKSINALIIDYTLPISFIGLGDGSAGGGIKVGSTVTLYGIFNADVSTAPSAPTIGTATAGDSSASITFTGVSGAASYTMTSSPGSLTATGTTSPITVTGLTNGTAYTFTCKANNPFGSSGASAASNSVTPIKNLFFMAASETTPYIHGYNWTDASGFGTKFSSPSTVPGQYGQGLSINPAGDVVAMGAGLAPRANAYPISTSGFGTKYANPTTVTDAGHQKALFHPSGSSIVFGANSAPNQDAYAWTNASGFGTRYSNPATALPDQANGIAFSPNGSVVVFATQNFPNINAYAWTNASGYGTKYANPSSFLASPGVPNFNYSGNVLVASVGSISPYIQGWPWSDSTGYGTKFADPVTPPPSTGDASATTNSGVDAVVIGHQDTPFMSAYPISSGSGFGTKYANASPLPAGRVFDAAFSSTNLTLALAVSNLSPNIQAYAWSNPGFGTKYANPATAIGMTSEYVTIN